jgi:uncharacterized protein
MARFVNREEELSTLEDWWRTPRGSIALVWGRRRVGKSTLLARFAEDKPTVFYVASGKPLTAELTAFSLTAAEVVDTGFRDLRTHPFVAGDDRRYGPPLGGSVSRSPRQAGGGRTAWT